MVCGAWPQDKWIVLLFDTLKGYLRQCVEARVSKTNNFDLMRPVTDEEIRSTMFQIPAIKSQGADGFSGRFSALLRRGEEVGVLHGVRVAAGGTAISHLLFADDAVIFREATVRFRHSMMPSQLCDLMEPGTGQWNEGLVRSLFMEEEARFVLGLPISISRVPDKLIWHHTRNGVYTVRTGYGLALDLFANGELGKRGLGMGTVRCNLERRHRRVPTVCALCGGAEETESHLFFHSQPTIVAEESREVFPVMGTYAGQQMLNGMESEDATVECYLHDIRLLADQIGVVKFLFREYGSLQGCCIYYSAWGSFFWDTFGPEFSFNTHA
ncbi:ribonuclease H protein [Pyrus ussuriensis x Pyrus communis]|uniref:Ribonuclease H protein n=1 Tax=Pyrus ussuriensis x Pyrus communis TaxID=2448454 RepID=A0A5N5H4J2_9ROSA|nr:ribonuclease H protein [Pyrus ussuriensis x Pyrus communis]